MIIIILFYKKKLRYIGFLAKTIAIYIDKNIIYYYQNYNQDSKWLFIKLNLIKIVCYLYKIILVLI